MADNKPSLRALEEAKNQMSRHNNGGNEVLADLFADSKEEGQENNQKDFLSEMFGQEEAPVVSSPEAELDDRKSFEELVEVPEEADNNEESPEIIYGTESAVKHTDTTLQTVFSESESFNEPFASQPRPISEKRRYTSRQVGFNNAIRIGLGEKVSLQYEAPGVNGINVKMSPSTFDTGRPVHFSFSDALSLYMQEKNGFSFSIKSNAFNISVDISKATKTMPPLFKISLGNMNMSLFPDSEVEFENCIVKTNESEIEFTF